MINRRKFVITSASVVAIAGLGTTHSYAQRNQLKQKKEQSMENTNFWAIIAQTRAGAGGNKEQQMQALEKILSEMSEHEIIGFDKTYHDLLDKAHHWNLWAAAYIINGGCSDDCFDYFCDWLIAQGQDVYEAALQDPQTLKSSATPWETDFEEFRYIMYDVYEKKFSKPLPAAPRKSLGEPKGVAWDEEEVEAKYPVLTEWVNNAQPEQVTNDDLGKKAPTTNKKSLWYRIFGKHFQ